MYLTDDLHEIINVGFIAVPRTTLQKVHINMDLQILRSNETCCRTEKNIGFF